MWCSVSNLLTDWLQTVLSWHIVKLITDVNERADSCSTASNLDVIENDNSRPLMQKWNTDVLILKGDTSKIFIS
jgi:hypothetical protein